jgi:integrase
MFGHAFARKLPEVERRPMARQVKNAKLDSRSARAKLPERTEPYWQPISPGCHLGYAKGVRGGSWIAKYRAEDGSRQKEKLGTADDVLDADGAAILSFSQAQTRAHEWFKTAARRAAGEVEHAPGSYMVRDAVAEYLGWFERNRKSGDRTRLVAEVHILPSLGGIEVAKLTKRRLEAWRDELVAMPPRKRSAKAAEKPAYRETGDDPDALRRRRSTTNRVWTVLRSALNRAYHEGRVSSDDAWRRIQPYRAVDAARVRWLTDGEIRRLLNACDGEFRTLATAALFSGARYGELAIMRAGDLDLEAGTAWIRPGKTDRGRHVYLTTEGKGFFRQAAAGKQSDQLLFWHPSGRAWGKSEQQRPLAAACQNAKLLPAISFHGFRHTFASRLVQRGVPLKIVADQLGHTDTRMVEKHYGHLAENHIAVAIRAAFGELGIVSESAVVPLRR